ncbi:MAG: prepilin-type N-terminal cleavage/methylation domain-containing protein [Magnetococcus sp. DMHC-6]
MSLTVNNRLLFTNQTPVFFPSPWKRGKRGLGGSLQKKVEHPVFRGVQPFVSFYSGQSAFTLIEMIMTMVIVGILAISVIPKFSSNMGAFFQAEQFAGNLRYAQMLAIGNLGGYKLQWLTSTTYQLLDNSSVQVELFDTDGAIVSNFGTISFDALGTPSASPTVTITQSGETQTVTIASQTGTALVVGGL